MFTINDLREKRANLWQEAKTFLDTHRTENGTLSAEDSAAYDRMEAGIIDLGKEITRMENLHTLETELNRPTAAPLTNRPGAAAAPAIVPSVRWPSEPSVRTTSVRSAAAVLVFDCYHTFQL